MVQRSYAAMVFSTMAANLGAWPHGLSYLQGKTWSTPWREREREYPKILDIVEVLKFGLVVLSEDTLNHGVQLYDLDPLVAWAHKRRAINGPRLA